MVRTWQLLLLGAFACLVGCEQNVETNGEQAGAQVAVLPGTESSRDFGDYVVHFNALTTDQLTPNVAQQYGIVRSQNRAMLNVSILRKEDQGMGTPVSGSVSASAINLTGQLKSIPLREIREGDGAAIYFIGEIGIANGETLIFTVDVTPINEASRFTVRFQKQFFVN